MTLYNAYTTIYKLLEKQFEGRSDIQLESTGVPKAIPLLPPQPPESPIHLLLTPGPNSWSFDTISVCLGVNREIRLRFKADHRVTEVAIEAWINPKRFLSNNALSGGIVLSSYTLYDGTLKKQMHLPPNLEAIWGERVRLDSKSKRQIRALKPIADSVSLVLERYFAPPSLKLLLDLSEET